MTLEEILDLRFVEQDAARGLLFEQAMREYVPWDFRPPSAYRSKTEQFDAIFEWNSWHFVVEAKAVRQPITPGSHEWEDFELKLRKRRGSCIGLFFSLFPISPGAILTATEMNKEGLITLVIDGTVLDALAKHPLPIAHLLHYMVLHAKTTGEPIPRDLLAVKKWCYSHAQVSTKVQSVCRSLSVAFLRRHALPLHPALYVQREVDDRIRTMAEQLRPALLSKTIKLRTHKPKKKKGEQRRDAIDYEAERAIQSQIGIIRDESGTGKTTLSVQIGLTTDSFFGLARAANEAGIDGTFSALEQIGPDFGIDSLIATNRPIVFAIDSLDEAMHIPGKRDEILGLIRCIPSLNEAAKRRGLIGFPILVVFTVREDYWLYWQAMFEGLRPEPEVHRKRFSRFSPDEFPKALENYAKGYNFVFYSSPSQEAAGVLSLPFNLHVFSEAHEFDENVGFSEIFDERVLQLYFERKRDNIIKRQVQSLSGDAFLKLLSECAMRALRSKRRTMTRAEFFDIIDGGFPTLRPEAESVLLAIVAEGTMARDPQNPAVLGFRHSHFMEYLVAWHIVRSFSEGRGKVEDMIGEVFESGVSSMYRIHDFVRFICERYYPDLWDSLLTLYAQSDEYMAKALVRLRTDIAFGIPLSSHSVTMIRRSLNALNPRVAWDGYFALAAKINGLEPHCVMEAFEIAWKANQKNPERWRILDKLATRGQLLNGKVIEKVLESREPREWEFLFGRSLSDGMLRAEFCSAFPELKRRVDEALRRRVGPEWKHSWKLWSYFVEDKDYVPGET